MESRVAEEILEELLSSLEALETQSGAILQFLKDKGIANDELLAPYLEQARNASNIRWRAARLRINRLLAGAFEGAEKSKDADAERSRMGDDDDDKDRVKLSAGRAETTNQNTKLSLINRKGTEPSYKR